MSTISSLADTVAARAADVAHLVAAAHHPDPTLAGKGFDAVSNESPELRKARNELANAAQELATLAQGPEDQLLQLAWSTTDTTNFAVILRFEIAQHVPFDSSISAADLAKAVNLPKDILTRVIRFAIGNGLFVEPVPNEFAHNATSALLARNAHLRDIATLATGEVSQMVLRLPDALKIGQQNGREGPPTRAFDLAHPECGDVFEYISRNPEMAQGYHRYMVGRSNTSRWQISHLLSAYDWAAALQGGKTIMDVGGSAGHTVLALAPSCPADTKFIVQDVDPVALKQGQELVSAVASRDVARRVEFQQHDFFQPPKATGAADVYLFRHIFHDWSDEDTVRILKAFSSGLRGGETVLVCEGIVPPPPAKRAVGLDSKQIL